MKIQNASRWQPYQAWQAWVGTTLCVAVAFFVRLALQPVVGPYGVFHLFILACVVVQYHFGYRFALLAMVVSAFLGECYFVEPSGTLSLDDWEHKDFVITLYFFLVTSVVLAFMERLQRSHHARDLLFKVLASRHRISLQRENDRLYYARKSNELGALVDELVGDDELILWSRIGAQDLQPRALFFSLTESAGIAPAHWQSGVHPEDLPRLLEADAKASGRLTLRLASAEGYVPVEVQVDHFNHLGRGITVVKRLPPEAP